MKPLFVTHDLIHEKKHLMPWRILCEVTRHLREQGHDVIFISLDDYRKESQMKHLPTMVLPVSKSYKKLAQELEKIFIDEKPDVIFWPITWREPRRRTKIIASFSVPLIGYFPGGIYSLRSVFSAIISIGFRAALPYLVEALAPKSRQTPFLRSHGFKHIITMTQLTARFTINAGWSKDRITVIPPGKEKVIISNNCELQDDIKHWLSDRPFYLFMGPPSKIRGIYQLLQAFEKAADKIRDVCLICLFRADGVFDTEKIRDIISKMRNKHRIHAIWDSLSKSELTSFIKACHAQILPFVLIPSEIPLAIIETMALGKPVVTTQSGGTGEFVSSFGIAVPPGDIDALAQAMINLFENDHFYKEKCKSAAKSYQMHPTWEDVSGQWLKVAKSVTLN